MSHSRILSPAFLHNRPLESYPYRKIEKYHHAQSGDSHERGEMPVGSLIGSELEEERRVLEAEKQIFDRIQQAEEEGKLITEKAYVEGFQAGEAAGRELGESQYRAYTDRLTAHLSELANLTKRLDETLEEEVMALSMAIGEHLAAQQIEASPTAVKALIERVVEELPFPLPSSRRTSDGAVAIYLNPKDYVQVAGLFEETPGLRLLDDPDLSRGGLRLESPYGVLDASLERRHARLKESMERILEERDRA